MRAYQEAGADLLFIEAPTTPYKVLANGELAHALTELVLVPALDGGAANAVGELNLALTHPAVMGLKDLKPIALGGAHAWPYASKAMPKVAAAGLAVVLGGCQVQHQHLVALAGVFQGALTGGFDAHSSIPAVQANRPGLRLGPHMNVTLAIDPEDGQIWQPQYRMNLGHGITSIELVFALTSLMNTVVPL